MKKVYLIIGLIIVGVYACNNRSQSFSGESDSTTMARDKTMTENSEESTIIDTSNEHLQGYHTNIEKGTLKNTDFRKVLYTGRNMQLVLMSLRPGEEIGEEVHPSADQFFRFESGKGECIVNKHHCNVYEGDVIVVPAGARHNVINTSTLKLLKMYTIYSPPQHKDKVIRATKNDAEINKETYNGVPTE
jgi:mannose-6-phosphate isomerase-like protein (cupin superfamily)